MLAVAQSSATGDCPPGGLCSLRWSQCYCGNAAGWLHLAETEPECESVGVGTNLLSSMGGNVILWAGKKIPTSPKWSFCMCLGGEYFVHKAILYGKWCFSLVFKWRILKWRRENTILPLYMEIEISAMSQLHHALKAKQLKRSIHPRICSLSISRTRGGNCTLHQPGPIPGNGAVQAGSYSSSEVLAYVIHHSLH